MEPGEEALDDDAGAEIKPLDLADDLGIEVFGERGHGGLFVFGAGDV